MRKYILFFLVLTAMLSCAAQNPDNMGQVEKFNYDYYHNKLKLNQRFKEYSEADGTFVKISVEVDGFFVEKIPPRSFTQNIIVYYKNGVLKEEGR